MKKRSVIFILCTFYLIPAFAQSWDEIKGCTDIYLWGDGCGVTIEAADQQALATLISKIAVVVSNDFTSTEEETTANGALDSNSYTYSNLQTYSASTLTNTERMVIQESAEQVCVGRYIKRNEVARIFEGRLRMVKEYVRLGLLAEKIYKIDDALRDFYWAFALLKTTQHPIEVTYSDEESGENILLFTWLPEKIRQIFQDLDAVIIGNDGTWVDLNFTYKGQLVSSLDFTYFDGRNWSNIVSAKNGRGVMEFNAGMVPENIILNYEYFYRGEAHINPEIKGVLDVVQGQPIKGSRVSIQSGTIHNNRQKNASASVMEKVKTGRIAPVKDERPYRTVLSRIVQAIQDKAYNQAETFFSEDGKEMFQLLITYGSARVLTADACTLYQCGNHVVARSIPMSFSFKSGLRKNFVEDIVFTFDEQGKVDCIAFGLDQKAKEDILNKAVWPMEARQTILEFLENYKTAYALKRLDYLRNIFDDDAVIIVGHVAQRVEPIRGKFDETTTYKTRREVTRTQYSKDQYMRNLEACFRSNEYVNIRFANNDVRKAKNGEEYGIQIKQDYYSSSYGDEGYLYIQVDLNDSKQPVIKVRTWQLEPDPEIGLFGLGSF